MKKTARFALVFAILVILTMFVGCSRKPVSSDTNPGHNPLPMEESIVIEEPSEVLETKDEDGVLWVYGEVVKENGQREFEWYIDITQNPEDPTYDSVHSPLEEIPNPNVG